MTLFASSTTKPSRAPRWTAGWTAGCALLLSLAMGCVTPGTLARPDGAAALDNDGSAEAQTAIREKYRLEVVEDPWLGFGLRAADGENLVYLNQPEVTETLASVPASRELLGTWGYGHASLDPLSRLSAIILGASGGVLFGIYTGFALDLQDGQASSASVLAPLSVGIFGGAVLGGAAGYALLTSADLLAAGTAKTTLRLASAAYNEDLDRRIAAAAVNETVKANAKETATETAPPPAPPAAAPAPESAPDAAP